MHYIWKVVWKVEFYRHKNLQVETKYCLRAIKMTNSAMHSNVTATIHFATVTHSIQSALHFVPSLHSQV